ncbi:dipeptidase [Oceanicella actignis]|uniref:dipeptidase n=1 Tax=Oceanicella actignis TaxID=1189325 RepID=UPI0011E78193|nr:membrane dipeptidase [Oceanicella actignis]TYO84839.1 membrane dipeptidase [Oceanicella actignis]
MISRRTFLAGAGLAAAGAAGWQFGLRPMLDPAPAKVGFELDDETLRAARDFMARHPIIDSHAHPGRTFLREAENLSFKIRLYKLLGGAFEERTLADMAEGGVDGAVFNGVADVQLLTLSDEGLVAGREFSPDEAWTSYRRQIRNLRALAQNGLVRLCLNSADVMGAKAAGQRAMILAMEGADFLENDLSRIRQAHEDGVRMLTLVHYHDNTLGDIMTGAVGSRGLTDFGREAVAAIQEAGVMIDLSHASEKTAFDVLSISKKPVVLTHTHINTPTLSHPRFVSRELAQAVAETGGYIGAWPAGIGIDSLAQFIDRVEFLLDAVGAAHVALGSDMDANYKPVLETYRKMPLVVGALMRRGVAEQDLAAIMGGNVLRVMDMSQA